MLLWHDELLPHVCIILSPFLCLTRSVDVDANLNSIFIDTFFLRFDDTSLSCMFCLVYLLFPV